MSCCRRNQSLGKSLFLILLLLLCVLIVIAWPTSSAICASVKCRPVGRAVYSPQPAALSCGAECHDFRSAGSQIARSRFLKALMKTRVFQQSLRSDFCLREFRSLRVFVP